MTSSDRIVVSKTVSSSKAVTENNSKLKLMMICCEENPPYGPSEDTAVMFLELLCQAYEWKCSRSTLNQEQDKSLTISITVYHAQSQDYPTTTSEWSGYDGIIIPGSLSAAYDTHVEWVGQLQSMIRTKIHEMRVKTLAVCFGHQTFAHAFGGGMHGSDEGGRAVKCPTGSKVGRIPSNLTPEGRHLLLLNEDGNNINSTTEFHMEMLYTHGDMVHSIPEFAVTLGGNEKVPIVSLPAMY